MNRFTSFLLLATLALLAITGCASLDPAGPYAGDKVLYDADGAIASSYELMHAFVKWEYERRTALKDVPAITTYADYIRANSKQWIRSAIAMRDAYAASPTKDPAELYRALAVLREAATQSAQYLLIATQTP